MGMKKWNTKQNMNYNWIAKDVEEETSEFMYQPSVTQWKNLKIGKSSVRQNVTYICKNSAAHKTMEGETKSFIKLLSNNHKELHTLGNRKNRLNVLEDQCYMKDDQWRQTVFEYSSRDLSSLPIRDMAVWELLGTTNISQSKWEKFVSLKNTTT